MDGFHDGDGTYRVRFMLSFEGEYTYHISGNYGGGECEGHFSVLPPAKGNHGQVHVAAQYHFAYVDGTPYFSIGTTCYVWKLQSDARIAETHAQLRPPSTRCASAFSRSTTITTWESRTPTPYEGTPMDSRTLTSENFQRYTFKTKGKHFDCTRFNPAHFHHVERCILEVQVLGIEVFVIAMHPYDHWGFCTMTHEQDELYWRYLIVRFSAFHNVWWSLANEYDLFPTKTVADWECFADIICECDPYRHLRSIHNCRLFYDHNRPWITHCGIQQQDLYKLNALVNERRERYRKSVVLDEITYDGNIQHGWGNISGEELIRRS